MLHRRERSLKVVGHDSILQPHEAQFPAGFAALYAENGSVARAIMEWRHKVVMLYVVTVGGAGSYWLWLYDHGRQDNVPMIFCAVAIVAAILGIMDVRNAEILKGCYTVGDEIERTVLQRGGGIYSALLRPRTVTYGRILHVVFFGTSALFFAAATVFGTRLIT